MNEEFSTLRNIVPPGIFDRWYNLVSIYVAVRLLAKGQCRADKKYKQAGKTNNTVASCFTKERHYFKDTRIFHVSKVEPSYCQKKTYPPRILFIFKNEKYFFTKNLENRNLSSWAVKNHSDVLPLQLSAVTLLNLYISIGF